MAGTALCATDEADDLLIAGSTVARGDPPAAEMFLSSPDDSLWDLGSGVGSGCDSLVDFIAAAVATDGTAS